MASLTPNPQYAAHLAALELDLRQTGCGTADWFGLLAALLEIAGDALQPQVAAFVGAQGHHDELAQGTAEILQAALDLAARALEAHELACRHP